MLFDVFDGGGPGTFGRRLKSYHGMFHYSEFDHLWLDARWVDFDIFYLIIIEKAEQHLKIC